MVVDADEKMDVVISGIGGYFPKSNNVKELTEFLMNQKLGIDDAKWKPDEFDYKIVNKSGNIDHCNKFDASYFGVHEQQVFVLDMMARMALQNCVEAIIDAGMHPLTLRKKKILVTMASSISENDVLISVNDKSNYMITGIARTMIANRVSYYLDSVGPSASMTFTWNGGIEALKQATDAVRLGSCDAALVGVSNMVLSAQSTYLWKLLDLISPDGKVRSFQENADGYIRSDGSTVLLIQRSDKAKRNYASIENINCSYFRDEPNQFLSFNFETARKFLTEFYQKAKIDPKTIKFIESYGSGVKKIDELEIKLLEDVFGRDDINNPLYVGALKKSLGHSEPASVFVGLVKAIIAMETGVIPANYEIPGEGTSKNLKLNRNLKLVTENTSFDSDYAAINCFGLSHAYGHILLKRGSKTPKLSLPKEIPLLYTFSTRTEEGVQKIFDYIKNIDEEYDVDCMKMMNDVFETNDTKFLCRGYTLKSNNTFKNENFTFDGKQKPIWFVYSGMGSQWATMGKSLMNFPIFARAVHNCATILKPYGVDLLNIITTEDEKIFDDILNCFVGIAAVQIGLTDILFAMGIVPDGLIGHSVGELGCAYADKCLTAKEMILAAYFRGRASKEATLTPGLMAAVGLSAKQIEKMVPPTIDVACHNGPGSATLSGPKEDIEKYVKSLDAMKIFNRLVNVAGIAYHSRYIKPAAPFLLKYMRELLPNAKKRSSKWLSSSIPKEKWNTDLAQYASADYFTNNLLSAVLFEETMTNIPENALLIEIAPHGILQAILKRSLGENCENVALTRRGVTDGLSFLFSAIGKIYLNGKSFKVSALYKDFNVFKSIVPRGTPSLSPIVHWINDYDWPNYLEESRYNFFKEKTIEMNLSDIWFSDINSHTIFKVPIIPGPFYLPLVDKIMNQNNHHLCVEFTNVFVQLHLVKPQVQDDDSLIQVSVQRGVGLFEISFNDDLVLSGSISILDDIKQKEIQEIFNNPSYEYPELGNELDSFRENEIYQQLSMRGLDLKGTFRLINKLQVYEHGIISYITWKENWSAFATAMLHTQMFHGTNMKSRNVILSHFQSLKLNYGNFPKENTLVKVIYNHYTKTLYSSIIQINDAKCVAPSLKEQDKVVNISYFEPLKNNKNISLEHAIQCVLQFICIQKEKTSGKTKMIIDNISSSVECILRNIHLEKNNYDIEMKYLNSYEWENLDNFFGMDVLVLGTQPSSTILEIFHRNPKAYLLTYTSNPQSFSSLNFEIILNYEINNYHLLMLKRTCKTPVTIINGSNKSPKITDLKDTSIEWVQKLNLCLEQNETKRIYLVFSSISHPNLLHFINGVKNLSKKHHIRLLFILDPSAPQCSENEAFYQKVFSQDLLINIYVNGEWCSFNSEINLMRANMIEQENQQKEQELIQKFNNMRSDLKIEYLGFPLSNYANKNNDNNSKLLSIPLMDYSGITVKDNKPIMGILNSDFEPDPVFQWLVPSQWSLIDGAATPATYALAYYILIELLETSSDETVLIQNGCTAIGIALFKVATNYLKCKTIMGVKSEYEHGLLLQNEILPEDNAVLDYSSPMFEQNLLNIKKYTDINVLVNCFDNEHMHSVLRNMGTYNRVAFIQDAVTCENMTKTIGLKCFHHCIGLHGVQLNRIMKLSLETKKRIHKFIQEGIENGHISPLSINVSKSQLSIRNLLQYVNEPQQSSTLIVPVKHQFSFAFATIGIVAGTEDFSEQALPIAMWLKQKGAQNIFISAPKTAINNFTLLQKRFKINTSSFQICSMLPSNQKYDAIIVLPKGDVTQTTSLNYSKQIMLSSSEYTDLLYDSRRSIINWNTQQHIINLLPILDNVLQKPVNINILHNVNENIDDFMAKQQFTYEEFINYLEQSTTSLMDVDVVDTNSVAVNRVFNSHPSNIMDNPPMFLVPGMMGTKCRYLQHTLSKLLCPIYSITMGVIENSSIPEIAAEAVKQIQAIYPKGPFNIVGVSTGGLLAIEITRQLETLYNNYDIQLYLLDGEPETLQNIFQEAVLKESINLEKLILQTLLRMKHEKMNDVFHPNESWTQQLKTALAVSQLSYYEKKHTAKVLNKIQNHLQQILSFKNTNQQITVPVKVFNSTDMDEQFLVDSNKVFKRVENLQVKGNTFTMLQSDEIASYINYNYLIQKPYTYIK